MRLLIILLLVSGPTFAQDVAASWPDLPSNCFVSGRPATETDAINGCAAFVIKGKNGEAGTPLDVAVPQYALHIDSATGNSMPVIIIQAEENSGIQVVGYRDIGSGEIGAALLSEMRLLGVGKAHGPGA